MWAHAYLAMTHLNAEGSDALKEKYLVDSINGDQIGCLCITEPFGGSDVAAMRTTAIKDKDHYIINGCKTFITNGVYSDYLIVAAKTDLNLGGKGISIFLIDRDTPGVSASKLDKLGWRASDTGEIAFTDVKIPASHLMGEENQGFFYIMQHFALERLIMGINAHARASYSIDYVIQYMSERKAFGKSLDQFQVLRHRIAEMSTEVEIVKTFNYHTILALDLMDHDLLTAIELANNRFSTENNTAPIIKENVEQKFNLLLTKMEYNVLLLIWEGKSNKGMGVALFVSVNTVKTHIKNLYEKFNVSSRNELLVLLR